MTAAPEIEGLTVDRLLGVGGMACVHAAHDDQGRTFAVKVLLRELAADPRVRSRFLREGAIASRVDHPALARVSRSGTTTDGVPYLVMELVEGETVEVVRRRLGGKMPLVPALRIADEVLDFLAACHDSGVLHRDIKTTNLVLTPARNVKVLDFGIATLIDDEARGARQARPTQGAAQVEDADMLLGTPSFMSPEQATAFGEELDARADVFSVGAVMFTLLSGQRLHRGRTHDESLFLAATQPAPSLANVTDDLPDDVIALVDRALARDRAARFPDARTMQRAIRKILSRESSRLSFDAMRAVREELDRSEHLALHSESLASAAPGSVRAPDAKGYLADTPLPHLLTHILARGLTGRLMLETQSGCEVIEFVVGAPIARGPSVEIGEVIGVLGRLSSLPSTTPYRFFIDDSLTDARSGRAVDRSMLRIEPLAVILQATRHLATSAEMAPRVRDTITRLGNRPLLLHAAAAPERFGLTDLETKVLDTAHDYSLGYPELLDAQVAPRVVVDPVVYALGMTRHLDLGVAGAWPIGVPRA